ncbi:MAG: RsmB/NOP family class I SAM-dependent RNA methyltransferase [Candidatus Bathyarchaeota archaeon]|nr:RsmB/NOP family class I SAM-dependent RNA methyltransferase [Candidatus Bathyarchaeota archaeon]
MAISRLLEKFLFTVKQFRLMSGRDFFINRYLQLGWEFRGIKARQAIRINQTNAKGKSILERLLSVGVKLEKIPFLDSGYWVSGSKVSVGATAEYLLGLYSVQEAAAQIPPALFSDLKGKTVLDACAAPGGKTVEVSDLMGNTGVVVALDVSKKRLAALANHLERCHFSNAVVYNMDARSASKLNLKFDKILLDAPCSGNFASDPFWFKRRTLKDVERNSALQKELLCEAEKCLVPGGELIYSTCSLEPEENELNMDWAVKNLNLQIKEINCYGEKGLTDVFGQTLDPSVAYCRRMWPGLTQGFFVCKLTKRGG